jgi:ketosteroid isomerase-like protein
MGNREVVERFAEALAADDFDAQDQLIHDDYVGRWPQSGEVIRGRANRRAILQNYPGGVRSRADRIVGSDDQFIAGPSWNIIHLVGSGDEITMTGTIDYGELGVWHFASLLTMRDGKIWRQTDFFGAPFDAPAWRAPYVEVESS